MPTTGGSLRALAPIGTLSYNGVTFDTLYHSRCNGTIVPDEANRITKYVEWSLEVEGLVTLEPGQPNTDVTWRELRQRLSVHGAPLVYTGNGFGGLSVNRPVQGGLRDVKWGPIPKILHFQPLGQGRSANIVWHVTTAVPEIDRQFVGDTNVLQFNWESTLSYDELGYSTISVRGTVEIPKTVTGLLGRGLTSTVDEFRQRWMDITFDLAKFRVKHREFRTSRDKRTAEWSYTAEELPRMGLPADCMDARGIFSVKPGGQRVGKFGMMNNALWVCSLRCTYAIRPDRDAALAAEAFYSLLWYRMRASALGELPKLKQPQQAPPNNFLGGLFGGGARPQPNPNIPDRVAFLIDFGFDEGLYLDSKTMTFTASWILMCTWRTLLAASGVWRWLQGSVGGNTWVQSVQTISGYRSWLTNTIDPSQDVIVDLGGPPAGPLGNPVR